jgi:GTP cyclohydrolase I
LAVDKPRVAAAVSELLAAIGEDPDRDGLVDTPTRVASMYDELVAGMGTDPREHLTVTFAADHDEMVMVRDIPFASLCEHHLIPFMGRVHVAYIPAADGRITGLSKLARLVEGYARRLQVQERMTTQIADAIDAVLDPRGGRGRAPVHVDAGGQEVGDADHHVGGPRPLPDGRGHPGRGDAVHPRTLIRARPPNAGRRSSRTLAPCRAPVSPS